MADDDDLDPDLDPAEERRARLDRGLRTAQAEHTRWGGGRVLAILAGVLVPLGVLLVLLGWHGASRTPHEYDQIPYLISGGQLGSTLAIVGALCFFAYWLTAIVREQRIQGRAVVEALGRLERVIAEAVGSGAAGPSAGAAAERLVATARGSLAHRPDCSAVVGRTGLRSVTSADGLGRCQLCLPGDGSAARA